MLTKEFNEILEHLVRNRNLNKEDVINELKRVLQESASWYYKTDAEVRIDGDIEVLIRKKVVKKVKNPANEITLEEAKKYDPEAIEGSEVKISLKAHELPRAVIYRAQNKFISSLRRLEKKALLRYFEGSIGELVRGKVQRVNRRRGEVILSIERANIPENISAEGYLSSEELIPGEIDQIKPGPKERLRAIIIGIDEKRAYILLSRTHPDFLRELLKVEIPDIQDGTIEIKQIARIPGKRAKVAVYSRNANIDPVAACVGTKGVKLNSIQKELRDEKVEIVKWDSDVVRFAVNSISPIPAITAYLLDDKIYIVVSDEDVAEAKGKEGTNVRLASKLVGKEVVIIPYSEYTKPKGVVTLIEIGKEFPKVVVEALVKGGYYSFNDVPTLASLYKVGLDERTALKLLEFIEEKLNE